MIALSEVSRRKKELAQATDECNGAWGLLVKSCEIKNNAETITQLSSVLGAELTLAKLIGGGKMSPDIEELTAAQNLQIPPGRRAAINWLTKREEALTERLKELAVLKDHAILDIHFFPFSIHKPSDANIVQAQQRLDAYITAKRLLLKEESPTST